MNTAFTEEARDVSRGFSALLYMRWVPLSAVLPLVNNKMVKTLQSKFELALIGLLWNFINSTSYLCQKYHSSFLVGIYHQVFYTCDSCLGNTLLWLVGSIHCKTSNLLPLSEVLLLGSTVQAYRCLHLLIWYWSVVEWLHDPSQSLHWLVSSRPLLPLSEVLHIGSPVQA
jgi:hypothetical protein